MRLTSVTLKNFRCYREEETIQIGDLTTIIGRNDVGKSSILHALEIFFNNSTVAIDCGDRSVASDDLNVEITCEFTDLPETIVLDSQAETTLEAEYLLNLKGNLCIKKVFKCSGAKPKEEVFVCALHPSTKQYDDLLELTNTGLKKRLSDLGIRENDVQKNNNPSIRHSIWSSCPNLSITMRQIPVSKEDAKRIWEKLEEHLPLFALFQSDRTSQDSDDEIQDPMKVAISAALAEPEIALLLDKITGSVRAKALEMAHRTHEVLRMIDPELAVELTPEFKTDPKWAGLFSVTLKSEQGIPVNKRGSGVRRLILVSFFRAEAQRQLEQGSTKNIIYAIEEPETSQHPHNQRILLESFQDLAAEPQCQVIITTHSPGFANYLPIDSFRFISRGEDGCPHIKATSDAMWDSVVNTLGIVPDNRVHVLVCVEGPTDVQALKCLSHELHIVNANIPDLSCDCGIAFVVLGGGTLQHWVNHHYLKGLNRPEVHLYDNDVAKYQNQVDQVNRRDDGSWAVLTSKREIENYLHPEAILEGIGISIVVGDFDDIPKLVCAQKGWNDGNAKRKLAYDVFPRMSAARIRERDPNGEVEGWLLRIANTSNPSFIH